MIAMRATFGLGNDFIDDAKVNQILRSQLERLSRFGRMAPILPQNRGARFRANDRIIGVFQNHDVIRDADTERATATAFANDSGENWDT